MTQALLAVGGLFLLVYLPLAVLAWRRPLLARFAFRESVRRRGQFALLVVGLMAASTAITASLVAADSLSQTMMAVGTRQLGAVDLTVAGPNGQAFSMDVARRLAADPALAPYVDGVQAGIETRVSVADLDQHLGKPNVLLVGFDSASQRGFGAFDLGGGHRTYGEDLAAGDIVLSSGLASTLEAKVGDHLRITGGGGGAANLRVYGIAAPRGPGLYGSSTAIYAPLGTAQVVTGSQEINVVRVAARASPSDKSKALHEAAGSLRAAVARIPSPTPLAVNELTRDVEQSTADLSGFFRVTNLGWGALTVVAAMAMIVNLVVALAEERRSRLAILRALGLTRAGLVILSVLEGAIYSVAAAIAGVVVGLPAGIYLAGQSWQAAVLDPLNNLPGIISLQLAIRPETLVAAFAAGALLTLVTAAAAAYRTSRLAIAEAIRDLPEPAAPAGQGRLRIGLLAIAAAAAAGLLVPNDGRVRLLGAVILLAVVTAIARGRLPDRARATLFGLGVTALAAITVASYRDRPGLDVSVLVMLMVLGIALPAVGLSIAVAANFKLVDAGLRLLGNRFGLLQAALRPPLAYLSRRPVRTGLAASAFALVVALLTLIAVIVGTNAIDYPRQSAGFDILVVSSGADPITMPPEVEQQVTGRMTLPMRIYHGPLSASGWVGHSSWTQLTFYVLPDQPQDAGPIALDILDRRFHSPSEAWQALRGDPALIVGPGKFGVSPGDVFTFANADGPVHLRLAAVARWTVLTGIVASSATVARFDTQPAGSAVLLRTKAGADNRALAHQIARSGFAQGLQATSLRDLLDQSAAITQAYVTQFDTLFHMGLLVGVLALAMLGIRAATERRRAIGVLRALGYQPPRLLAGLVAEAGLTATLGVLAGVGSGLACGYLLLTSSSVGSPAGSPLNVSLPRLGIALAIVYATVVLVAAPLATRASRMAPAEAIRMTG